MLELAAQDLNLVVVTLQDVVDTVFFHADPAESGKAAIAGVGDGAASGLQHARLEARISVLRPSGLRGEWRCLPASTGTGTYGCSDDAQERETCNRRSAQSCNSSIIVNNISILNDSN
ncbi:hypothetical protein [Candidatus Ferrigenium straubiae]|jgi:hypothetical protein|uniref:hypothetical protein n=1 Tax=Candidatus Ferrigenium straubiae TaxID=2919506 RepID=UPI003F4ACF7F